MLDLAQHVLDDDDRTRRASLLLSHLTVWLVFVSSVLAAALVLLAQGPYPAAVTGGSGLTVAAALALRTWLRRRRLQREPDPADP